MAGGRRGSDHAAMSIHDWPPEERPREKLMTRGPTALSDAELLALFLGSGFGGRDAVQTARDLLGSHGPLRVLLDRPAAKLAHRYLAAELAQGESVGDNPLAVGRYLQHRLRGQARELFLVLFLDNRHRLIACEELFAGTINTAPVYPREVVRRALLHNAAAVILSHNHPSGDPEPSGADARITEELQQALALVDIRLLDHFVIGEGRPVSFAERGLLPQHQPRLFG